MPNKDNKNKKDNHDFIKNEAYYKELGRSVDDYFEGLKLNQRKIYLVNFLRGVFFGFGTFLGGTVLVALMLWVLSYFDTVPFVGNFVDSVQNSVD